MNQTIKNRIEQINRGEVPDGYRKTGVGIFPTDWVESTLKKEGTFLKGCGIPGDKMTSAGIPCVGYGDLYMKYDVKFEKSLSFTDRYTALQSKKVDKGALLFTATGETAEEIGKCVCYWGDEPIYVGGDIFIFNSKDVEPLFVSYQQNVWSFIKQKARLGQGHSIVHIREGALAQLSTIYPKEKTKQQRISEILMKWDDAVELQEKLVNRLLGQSKAIVQRIMKPQAHWASIKLNTILKERKVYEEKNDRYPHVTLSKEGIVDKGDQYNRDFLVKSDDKKYKVTFFNDLCYNPANLKFGVICLNKYGTAIFSPIYVTYEINKQYNPDFIGAILTDGNFINKIRKYEEGTIFERQAVNPKDFLRGKIHVPPSRNEQDDIARLIIKHFENTSLQAQKLEALKKQRKALRQLLLTGIVRV